LTDTNSAGDAVGGLRLIAAPSDAALNDFTPWPLARNISGMLLHDDMLIFAVNRDGFFAALPAAPQAIIENNIAFYRIADSIWWNRYSVDSLFMFAGNPTALFYRDDFFINSPEPVPAPRAQSLVKGETRPIAVELPAFARYAASDGWELDSFRQGPDGAWYCRGIQRAQAKIVYLRASELAQSAETVLLGAFMNSANPESVDNAPPLLRETLNAAFALSGAGKLNIAAIISQDFSYTRHFSTRASDSEDDLVELSGYSTANRALVMLPDGRGVYGAYREDEPPAATPARLLVGADQPAADAARLLITPFELPPLPRGFVYTGVGPAGDAVIASWEEQEDLSVGAAGLMIVRLPAPRD
jgi:hypothetical protein